MIFRVPHIYIYIYTWEGGEEGVVKVKIDKIIELTKGTVDPKRNS